MKICSLFELYLCTCINLLICNDIQASVRSGDRVWRMPLFNHYTNKITECQLADLNNIGGSRSGGACTAAAFLKVSSDTEGHLSESF